MLTKSAKIRAMSSVACGIPPRISLLLDTGYVIKMRPQDLDAWHPKLTLGDTIAYDIDETTGAMLNPRPVPAPVTAQSTGT